MSITHDPELYARMAEPYPDTAAAEGALAAFFADVETAREKHRIPEFVLMAAAHVEGQPASLRSLTRGSAEWAEHLAAIGFRLFVAPMLARAKKLQTFAMGSEEDDE